MPKKSNKIEFVYYMHIYFWINKNFASKSISKAIHSFTHQNAQTARCNERSIVGLARVIDKMENDIGICANSARGPP